MNLKPGRWFKHTFVWVFICLSKAFLLPRVSRPSVAAGRVLKLELEKHRRDVLQIVTGVFFFLNLQDELTSVTSTLQSGVSAVRGEAVGERASPGACDTSLNNFHQSAAGQTVKQGAQKIKIAFFKIINKRKTDKKQRCGSGKSRLEPAAEAVTGLESVFLRKS